LDEVVRKTVIIINQHNHRRHLWPIG
jgi:hypothetical protein